LVDAVEAGLWQAFMWEDRTPKREIIAVPRPALRIENDRLHCADAPAVCWPQPEWGGGESYYFWHGVQVPERVILAPEGLTAEKIAHEGNVEVRRIMIERFGVERYLRDSWAEKVSVDDYGTLWRVLLSRDEPLVLLQVLNSTPETDGSFRDYFLRVPPNMRTAREAVAWSFGYEEAQEYQPGLQT
jgi:hypothetical protein